MAFGRLDADGYYGGSAGDLPRALVDDSCVAVQVSHEGAGELLSEREKTHGDFREVARIADELRYVISGSRNWPFMQAPQREALAMISSKIARILSGDSCCKDHWVDIEGYAALISRTL